MGISVKLSNCHAFYLRSLVYVMVNFRLQMTTAWVSSSFDDFDDFGQCTLQSTGAGGSSSQSRKRPREPSQSSTQRDCVKPMEEDELWTALYTPKSLVCICHWPSLLCKTKLWKYTVCNLKGFLFTQCLDVKTYRKAIISSLQPDLAVHKKKVAEFQGWLEDCLRNRNRQVRALLNVLAWEFWRQIMAYINIKIATRET